MHMLRHVTGLGEVLTFMYMLRHVTWLRGVKLYGNLRRMHMLRHITGLGVNVHVI